MTRSGSRGWHGPALAGLLWALFSAGSAVAEGPAAEGAVTADEPPVAEASAGAGPGAEASAHAPAAKPSRPASNPALAIFREGAAVRREANRAGIAAQKRIDELSNKTDALYARYTAALSQLESLRFYNSRMRELVATQESELGGLRTQLDQVDAVGRSVTPLMLRMIDSLDTFIELDVPFLLEERRGRVAELRELMMRADVAVSEKYRRIMEAYQIESEYGRTIEAYQGPLEGEAVDFLRFGRIALMYLTLDQEDAGVWDPESRSWQPLDGNAASDVLYGLRIARKLIPPDLIRLPLPEPERRGEEG